MSRIGKIARLPRAVREELNWRLLDGEQQSRLVEWLNGREEVQAMLRAEFSGQPINEPNLTAWVQGGFEDWRRQQEATEAAGRLAEESRALAAISGDQCLVDRVSMMAALALGEQLMAVRRMEDGTEKRKAVLKLVRGLVRLRKSDREQERGQREAAEDARTAEVHEDWAARMRPRKRRTKDRGPSFAEASTVAKATADKTAGRRKTDGSEHDYEQEHECARSTGPRANAALGDGQETDVRRRMAEVLAGMSDEQIAESLRRSGHLPVRQSPGQTQHLPPERVWWTEEDQALDEAEEKAEADARSTGPRANAAFGGETARTPSTERGTSNAEVSGTSIIPPPGRGTTSASMSTHVRTSAGGPDASEPSPSLVHPGAADSGRSTGSGQRDPALQRDPPPEA